jgi:hypothetical protein
MSNSQVIDIKRPLKLYRFRGLVSRYFLTEVPSPLIT